MPGKNSPKLEIRSTQELRGIGEDGSFTGYIAVWDTVDDYDSMFMRGAFAKTIRERSHKIKVFFDHDELIGRNVEIREDDHGVFVHGQLTLGVRKAQETYEFLKDKTLDALSFGFRTIKDKWVDGVRQISEVRLYEYGPVVFEANEAAEITDVRAERILSMNKTSKEERATEFARTQELQELRNNGDRLIRSLVDTLWDIWWAGDAESIPGMADKAIADFNAAYLEWTNAFIAEFMVDEARSVPGQNELSSAFTDHLASDEALTLESMASDTSFTIDELRSLQRGELITNREKLSELPDEIRKAHQSIRNAAVEALFTELRNGLSAAESKRIIALLAPAETRQSEPGMESVLTKLTNFRQTLNGENNAR